MTFPQYNDVLTMVARKLNWDIIVACTPLSGEVEEDLNPLFTFSNEEDFIEPDRVMTIKDIENFERVMKGG